MAWIGAAPGLEDDAPVKPVGMSSCSSVFLGVAPTDEQELIPTDQSLPSPAIYKWQMPV